MTTFQDLPPQSRRAVRQSERDGDTSSQVASGSLPTAQPFLPAPAATAEGQQPAQQQPAAPPASGRRSRAAAPSGLVDMPTTPPTGYPAPEPLTYTTQATPAFQQQPAPAQPATEQQASEQYSAEQQAYRIRDFSPEGRRAAQTGAPQQPAAAPLDYRTQAGPPPASPAPTSPPVAGPTATTPPVAAPTATTPPVAGPTATNPPVAGPTATTPPVAGPTATTPPVAAAAPVSAAPSVAPVAPTQTAPPVAPPTSRRSAGAAPQQTSPDLPTQTLSRRELRALQAEQDAAAALTSGTYEAPPLVEPVAAPPSNLSNAMAEFEALTRASQAAQQATAAQQVPAAEQSATASQPDLFGAARAEQARIEQAERARAQQAAENQAAENQAAENRTAESQAAQQQAAQEAEQARARFEHDERARAEAEARAQQATQAEAAQLAQAHAARAREEAAQAAQQQAQQHADQQRAEHETAQQRAREAAAAAQATAQAEANARALAESQQQAEILARREWDAQQAQQAAAQQAPAQPRNPFDALLGGASAPSATNPPASDPLTALFVEPIEQTGSHATSTGHWSQQAQIEDDEQPFENTLSRDVGGGNVATTTSALVLPVMPTADFGGIISGTGEILVTGSIELPRSLGTTGGDSRRYDDPDVDNLFDAFDNEIISTDSAPVRAIRAVSTHTSTHGVITTANKPHGNRLLLAALIAIPVLIVGIAGLLIAAFSSGMF